MANIIVGVMAWTLGVPKMLWSRSADWVDRLTRYLLDTKDTKRRFWKASEGSAGWQSIVHAGWVPLSNVNNNKDTSQLFTDLNLLVYKIYGLDEHDISIIEKTLKS